MAHQVEYEIKKAWSDSRGLFGIYIHNLKCPRNGKCEKGSNPFANFNVGDTSLSRLVNCYNPPADDAYNYIADNLDSWVTTAIADAKRR